MRACVAVGTRGGSLASTGARAARAPAHGGGARRVLRGLLLGAHGGPLRPRGHEHRLDGARGRADRRRGLLPWKTIAGCGVAVALALLALGVAFAPEDVPGFTIPGSHRGEATMDSMQMP